MLPSWFIVNATVYVPSLLSVNVRLFVANKVLDVSYFDSSKIYVAPPVVRALFVQSYVVTMTSTCSFALKVVVPLPEI